MEEETQHNHDKIRVCMFARSLPAHAMGGMELHIDAISRSLAQAGADMTLVTTAHPGGKEYEENDGVKIYYVKGTKPGKYSGKWWVKGAELFEGLYARERFDLIHGQSAGAYYLLRKQLNKRYHLPVLTTLHGTSYEEMVTKLYLGWGLKTKIGMLKNACNYFFTDRFYLSHSDVVITTNSRQYSVLKKHYGISEKRIHLIYNGIDDTLFKHGPFSRELAEKWGIKESEFKILCVARLRKEKGIQVAIRAFAELRAKHNDAKMVIIGDGADKMYFETLVRGLGIREGVVFTGYIPHVDIAKYLNLCDVYVNPTLRESGLDLTIPEAMASERCVVCSELESIQSILQHGTNGLMFPKGNFEVLAGLLDEIHAGKYDRKKIGSRARATVEKEMSHFTMVEKTLALYRKMAEGKTTTSN